MKNYIDIYDANNNKKQMEIISTFKLTNYTYNYIIYTDLEKKHFYVSKYTGNKLTDLNSDFSKEELILCNKVFREVLNNARTK